jgi:hypothetical protein
MAQSLFGLTPEQIQEARRMQQQQAINQQAQSFGMFGPLYAAGRGMAQQGIQSLAGLFPGAGQDPTLQRATITQSIIEKYKGQDFNDPSVLSKMASEFSEAGIPDVAMELGEEARKRTPKASESPFAKINPKDYTQESIRNFAQSGDVADLVSAEKPEKENIVKTGEATAKAASELGFGVRPTLDLYSQEEMAAINNLLQTRGEKIQAAGVPQPGQVKISDLKGAQDLVNNFTKSSQEKLATARDARTQLILAKQGNGTALAQLQRQLVTLVGDNQIGLGEVRMALGSAGIVGDTISAVNQFMTGVPTIDKLNSVERVINALEKINAQSYNQGRIRAQTVLREGALSPQTVDALIPPEYILRRPGQQQEQTQRGRQLPGGRGPKQTEAKPPQFQEGKVYTDANGNRARYVNGSWVPLQ